MKIQSTYLCAHAVPIGSDAEKMTNEITTSHIEKVANADLDVENIDIFCEAGVYSADQTEKMLRAGVAKGWNINFHAEEIKYIGGTEMGCKLGARAISHLEMVSDDAIGMMAKVGHSRNYCDKKLRDSQKLFFLVKMTTKDAVFSRVQTSVKN